MHSNRTLFSREEMFCLRKVALQEEKKKENTFPNEKYVTNIALYILFN